MYDREWMTHVDSMGRFWNHRRCRGMVAPGAFQPLVRTVPSKQPTHRRRDTGKHSYRLSCSLYAQTVQSVCQVSRESGSKNCLSASPKREKLKHFMTFLSSFYSDHLNRPAIFKKLCTGNAGQQMFQIYTLLLQLTIQIVRNFISTPRMIHNCAAYYSQLC